MSLLFLLLLLCPCPVKRDRHGKILRRHDVLAEFKRLTGYPNGRKGYVIDHLIPLCACGADSLPNLSWQRADSARLKDRLERAACARMAK